MKRTVLIILTCITSFSAFGDEFILGEYRRYGSYNYLEIGRNPKGWITFEQIFSLINPTHEKLEIRILSPLTDAAKEEIMSYFHASIPGELEKALKSSGNIHNPAVIPLAENFIDAFKETNLFKKYAETINGKGYVIKNISYEKLSLHEGKLFVTELNITCEKLPNKALNSQPAAAGTPQSGAL